MALQHVVGKNKGHIVLYALSTCPWCRKTKKLLEDLGVEYYFGDVDLMNDADKKEALQVVQKCTPTSHNYLRVFLPVPLRLLTPEESQPSPSFPTMIIDNNTCIVGFQENKIKEIIGK